MRIGYYVHHHGHGHFARACAIAARVPDVFTLLGTGLAERCRAVSLDVVDLPDDRLSADFDGDDGEKDKPSSLHYAPLGHRGARERAAIIANWIAGAQPDLLVVDVSVEIVMLSRLLSVPTVYVRLAGRREDPPHLEAFRSAKALMCPFHADLDLRDTPRWVAAKSRYFAGLTEPAVPANVEPDLVVAIFGSGGAPGDGSALAAMARAHPDRRVRAFGPVSEPEDRPANLELCGWVDDALKETAKAGLVIGSGGDGVVNAVIAAGRPFVCMPQDRPYDEQLCKARRLDELAAAVVIDEWPRDWTGLIAEAQRRSRRMPALHDERGAEHAANFLIQMAGGSPRLKPREAACAEALLHRDLWRDGERLW